MKGYIDEQIAWLQSVTVNEQLAHDIISFSTCAEKEKTHRHNLMRDGESEG